MQKTRSKSDWCLQFPQVSNDDYKMLISNCPTNIEKENTKCNGQKKTKICLNMQNTTLIIFVLYDKYLRIALAYPVKRRRKKNALRMLQPQINFKLPGHSYSYKNRCDCLTRRHSRPMIKKKKIIK